MRKYIDGKYIEYEMSNEEIAVMESEQIKAEAEYWANVDYDTAVENEIAKRYTIGQELAIQRQREEKPKEYEAYYAYCEQCKAYVKEKKAFYKRPIEDVPAVQIFGAGTETETM